MAASFSEKLEKDVRMSWLYTIVCLRERCSILSETMHGTCFACHTLDQHSNSHSTGESMRVDDNIRLNTTFTKRHINRWPFLRANAFLTMSGRKLITDHRRTTDSQSNVDLLKFCVTSVTA